MSVTWQTFRNAIFAWAKTHSGLANGALIWSGQDAPRPAYPYGVLNIISNVTSGGEAAYAHVLVEAVEAVEADPEADPPVEAVEAVEAVDEMAVSVGVTHTITVSFQAISQGTTASTHAMQFIEAARAGLRKPSQRVAFSTADIAFNRVATVQDLSGLGSGEFLSRVSMDVVFSAVFNYSDTSVSYIETLGDVDGAFERADGTDAVIDDDIEFG